MEIFITITSKDDTEHFILELDIDKWEMRILPEDAIEIGSFSLAQVETIKYGQTDNDGALNDVVTITLYDRSYIGFEINGLNMSFDVSEATTNYLKEYFE